MFVGRSLWNGIEIYLRIVTSNKDKVFLWAGGGGGAPNACPPVAPDPVQKLDLKENLKRLLKRVPQMPPWKSCPKH